MSLQKLKQARKAKGLSQTFMAKNLVTHIQVVMQTSRLGEINSALKMLKNSRYSPDGC